MLLWTLFPSRPHVTEVQGLATRGSHEGPKGWSDVWWLVPYVFPKVVAYNSTVWFLSLSVVSDICPMFILHTVEVVLSLLKEWGLSPCSSICLGFKATHLSNPSATGSEQSTALSTPTNISWLFCVMGQLCSYLLPLLNGNIYYSFNVKPAAEPFQCMIDSKYCLSGMIL